MKLIAKKIILIFMIVVLINTLNATSFVIVNATTNLKSYKYTAKEKLENSGYNTSTNGHTLTNIRPNKTYDFFDEDGIFNSVCTSSENVYWYKYNDNMEVISEYTWPLYYRISIENKDDVNYYRQELTSNFGNAIYNNGYLYIVYGRAASYKKNSTEKTIAIGKYDKNGNEVLLKEYLAEHLSQDYVSEGTSIPFYASSNCSLAINDGKIACLFGKHMFSGHEDSLLAFFDIETLDYVSDLMQGEVSLENRHKYYKIYNHSIPHSMGQRIIRPSDGNFLMAEYGDSGVYGFSRGLMLTKIYDYYDSENNIQTLNKKTVKMHHISEGGPGTYGYNNIYSMLGEIIELSDGYIYAGATERTLSRKYGYYINEERDLFVQKYAKDFYLKDTEKERQMLNTDIRETADEPSVKNSYGGRLYLTGNEKDYGMKWLTNLNNKAVNLIRTVKLENDNVAILWEETKIKETTISDLEREKAYSVDDSGKRTAYYMIIDKDANIVQDATEIPNVSLSVAEKYPYKNGKIYWTTTYGKEITVNILDIKNTNKYKQGDVNMDGKVNAGDYVAVLNYVRKKIKLTDEQIQRADANGDGKVNAGDYVTILNIVRGKI